MSPTTKRYVGIALALAAAVVFFLNLQRVANLGMNALAFLLLIMGIVFITSSRRAKNN